MATSKKTTKFQCPDCHHESPKFFGMCPSKGCSGIGEEIDNIIITMRGKNTIFTETSESNAVSIFDVKEQSSDRIDSGFSELNNLFGVNPDGTAGIALHSLTALSGPPGIGKSTLLLQLLNNIQKRGLSCVYVSAEESVAQTKSRFVRLGLNEQISVEGESDFSKVLNTIQKYDFIIIDSISTMYFDGSGVPGGVAQIKEISQKLTQAKMSGKTIIVIAHINGEGDMAGPKSFEHDVDCVLYFENFDDTGEFKILSTTKNRFGKVNETAIFAMDELGLQPILDPSTLFLQQDEYAGSALSIIFKGNRPIFVEIESLVNPTTAEKPFHNASGFDQKRISQLMAIAQKHLKFMPFDKNIFISSIGGLNFTRDKNVHLDLSVIASILSSHANSIVKKYIFIGEVSLSGAIRTAPREKQLIEHIQRISPHLTIISNSTGYKHISRILEIFPDL